MIVILKPTVCRFNQKNFSELDFIDLRCQGSKQIPETPAETADAPVQRKSCKVAEHVSTASSKNGVVWDVCESGLSTSVLSVGFRMVVAYVLEKKIVGFARSQNRRSHKGCSLDFGLYFDLIPIS